MTGAAVTVLVPVHGGLDDVRRCLAGVVRHAESTRTPFELLVIDDASPEPEVPAYLDAFAAETRSFPVQVVRNERNLGFVATCNRGFRQAAADVVLLNSDTVVTSGWLDRLACAAAQPAVATVTPLTNFGSICTLPDSVATAFHLAGPEPRIDECAAFVREHSVARRPEVITGVGFCMYVTRAALDAVGTFDAETFGAGYGEEVDFCLRASAAGFRHLVEDSTFVYHRGAVSFGERRERLLRRSSELINERYPFFRAANRRERREDPLRVSFTALELGLEERRRERPHVLQILHSRPGELGGTQNHFSRLVDSLLDEFDVSVLQPAEVPGEGFLLTTIWHTGRDGPTRREHLLPARSGEPDAIDDPGAESALRTALDMFDFDSVHIQNIFRHSLAPLKVLADFPGPVACSVRDLYLACPHHWLLYRNTQSCGIPEDLSYCATCLPETRGLDVEYLERFRRTVSERIGSVDRWVFASHSAVDFFRRVYDLPDDRIEVIEHGAIIDTRRSTRVVDERLILDEPLRVAYVGIGWAKKGLPAVNALADAFAGRNVELHHFGELREPVSDRLHVHGRYENDALPELLDRAGIQVVLLPGPFIETFGHVLTESIVAGRPVIGSRWGALGERIRRHEVGWTIDPEDVDGMRELVDRLDRCRLEVLRATRRAVAVELRPVEATTERYAALYRDARRRVDGGHEEEVGSVEETERLRRELRAMAVVNRQLQLELSAGAGRRSGGAAGASPAAGSPVRRLRRSISRRGLRGTASEAARRLAADARRGRAFVERRGARSALREATRRTASRLRRMVGG